MAQEKLKIPEWLTRLLEPQTNFYALLNRQAETTLSGMEALERWLASGAGERCQIVRDLEHTADEQKLDLQRKLAASFVTPFDREDIYDLSLMIDEVINSAKNTCRQIEALHFCPRDPFLMQMASVIVTGSRALVNAFRDLRGNPAETEKQALLARKCETAFAKLHRQALQEVITCNDFKIVVCTMEVYRCLAERREPHREGG